MAALRGLAMTGVVEQHCGLLPCGWTGVWLFYVISGFVITSSLLGFDRPAIRDEHWITLLRARAIENQAYVAGINRCGQDPNHDYAGGSLIVAPAGCILAEGGKAEEVICHDIDGEIVREYRERFPALQDR